MSERRADDKTADELEREGASRLEKVQHTFNLRARQILLMEFEQLRALAKLKRRGVHPHEQSQ